MNKNMHNFAWSKMSTLLDKEMPMSKSRPSKWMGYALLLFLATMLSGLAYFIVTQDQTQTAFDELNASHESEYIALRSELTKLHDQLGKKDILLNEIIAKQNNLPAMKVVHHAQLIEVPYFVRSLNSFELPTFSHESLGISAMNRAAKDQIENKLKEISQVKPLDDMSIVWEEELPSPAIFPSIERTNAGLFQKVKPAFFGDFGYTRTSQDGKSGMEVSIGAVFFPKNRLSIFLATGVMNQKTPIFNQTTAAKASWQRGFSTLGIASEVEEESVSFSNYGFLNVLAGLSYQASPKIKLLTSVKGSYILDKINFSEASIETSERTIRVTETLDDLVDENQVHRWGFSGVVGAEYEVTDKVGIQISYNKFITPLVSSLPFEFQDNEVNLSDFGKVSLSYNF